MGIILIRAVINKKCEIEWIPFIFENKTKNN